MGETDIQDRLARRASNPEVAAAMLMLDLLGGDHIVPVAERLLDSGYDSASLRILAGEVAPIASEWLPAFKKAMTELNVQVPSRLAAAEIVAREIAAMIVEKELAPQEGAEVMWDTLFIIDEFAPKITIFSELAWALDSGPEPKPFPELSRAEIERRIIEEAKRVATTERRNVVSNQKM